MALPETLAAWRAAEPALNTLCAQAQALGAHLWLVGGAVKRALAQADAPPEDIDVCVVGASAQRLTRTLADETGGHYLALDPAFGIYRAALGARTFDLAEALHDDMSLDLARRDLTMNAMAVNLADGALLDPFEGERDWRAGVIRMIDARNFDDDPLRLLRAFRFMAHARQGQLDGATREAIAARAARAAEPAGERLHVEFLKLLSAPQSFDALAAMAQSGVLEALLPEMTPMRGVPPNAHHHLGLFEHTLELARQCERLLPTLTGEAQAYFDQALTPFTTRAGLVKLGCLLHDVGKPQTWVIQPNGRHTFYGHDKASETMAEAVARRWKLSRSLTERLKKLTRWHLYPCQFGPASSRRSILKFLRRLQDDALDVTLLALADRHSTLGPEITPQTLETADAHHRWLMAQTFAEAETMRLPPLLDGKTVMTLLDLAPGPDVGRALAALSEAHQLGEIGDADQARAWLLKRFKPE